MGEVAVRYIAGQTIELRDCEGTWVPAKAMGDKERHDCGWVVKVGLPDGSIGYWPERDVRQYIPGPQRPRHQPPIRPTAKSLRLADRDWTVL